ncbi:hypothetical protein Cgig2_022164 [Carnegiea gigantea]|uniref:Uncharacterized protein n=1 Tax=Carnegiea gigantea TaxID=171969 RepID=A0A9Q1GMI7_9CARY|nr:hypothetical protein Cgig2_022164 [Carnegiea gigantea]
MIVNPRGKIKMNLHQRKHHQINIRKNRVDDTRVEDMEGSDADDEMDIDIRDIKIVIKSGKQLRNMMKTSKSKGQWNMSRKKGISSWVEPHDKKRRRSDGPRTFSFNPQANQYTQAKLRFFISSKAVDLHHNGRQQYHQQGHQHYRYEVQNTLQQTENRLLLLLLPAEGPAPSASAGYHNN